MAGRERPVDAEWDVMQRRATVRLAAIARIEQATAAIGVSATGAIALDMTQFYVAPVTPMYVAPSPEARPDDYTLAA